MGTDVIGYEVEALDGSIGRIAGATRDGRSAYVIVDTGPWVFGRTVMLPAGVIHNGNHAHEKVFVNRTQDQIKDAPEFDDSLITDESYRGRLRSYYGVGGLGDREFDDRI